MKESRLLGAFCPNRKDIWRPLKEREDVAELNLVQPFSFLDRPLETINSLMTLAKGECQWGVGSRINYKDEFCRDLAPYIVLGLMGKDMSPIFTGGMMSKRVGVALKAAKVDALMRIKRVPTTNDIGVFPFRLRTRNPVGMSVGVLHRKSDQDKFSAKLVDTLNGWLGALPSPVGLTDQGETNVFHILTEMLDNAVRHSDLIRSDGKFYLAGLMQGPFESQSDPKGMFCCNISMLSLGSTIYQSLQSCPTDLRAKIESYVRKHRARDLPEEVLWNVMALQDTVSRIKPTDQNPLNGYGFGTALSGFCDLLSYRENEEIQPLMCILSGRSCITIKEPYKIDLVAGKRCIAFNAENTLDSAPDARYVQYLPIHFPGTIVSVRFFLDSKFLQAKVKNKHGDGKN